ncbi:hypothetical protein JCM14076_08650 [Methylosoma difficile]
MKKKVFIPIAGLALALSGLPAQAQVFGSLANFDVVNDTGKTAHGFEIELHDIHANQITSIFGDASRWPNMERYGSPTVTEFTDATGFGVRITYKASNSGTWSAGTPSGTLPVSPSDSCWPLGAKDYGSQYPCDHFGVSTTVNTPNVKYSWLVEDMANPAVLTPVQASVPNPVWTVVPQPPINNVPQAPKVNVAIAAPKPNFYEFGEPRWVKVTATGTLQDVAVEDLVAENAIIKKARTQTQLEWQLLQTDTGNPAAGQIDLTGVALDPGAKGVVYRFEFYKYTGNRDAATNEALVGPHGDTPGAIGPSAGDLGTFIVAQNAGINFDGVIPAAPPLPIAPSINATIAGATVNSPYYQTINATPGNPLDTLAITVTGLPAGLVFDSASNSITGTPTAVGSFPLVINVQDLSNGTSTSATTQMDVADAPIVFNLSLAQGTVDVPYSQTLSVTGGYGAISYSSFGSLPAGLSLVGDSITGTPTTEGSTTVQLTATDALGYSQNASQTLTIVPAPVLNPPPGPGAACSATNKVISNVTKYWLDIAGGIPNGGQSVKYAPQANTTFVAPLLMANGFKFGQVISYSGVMDAGGFFCLADSMTVAAGLSLAPVTLPNGQVGSPFTATAITPAGGIKPYTVAVSGLPAGLSFDGINIVGTPALGSDGLQTVSVSVNDSMGETVNTTLSFTITPAPVVVPALSLPTGTVGVSYSGSASATGGVGSLSVSVTGLPAGLTYAAGNIAGVPSAAGASSVTVTAKDSIGQSVSSTSVLTINPSAAPAAIKLGTSSVPKTGTVGVAYKGTVKASGGVGALTWKGAGLPKGVVVSTAGVMSGKPSTVGTYNTVLTVTDSIGQTAKISAKIVISATGAITCTVPAGGTAGLNSLGKITAISANVITFKTAAGALVKVTVPVCATVQWNGGATAYAIGQVFEWNGYRTAATGNVAQSVVVN